jgi:glycosyltransferase involved in cell wall biosynthesis
MIRTQTHSSPANHFSSTSGDATRYEYGISICIPAFNEQETIENSIITASETLQQAGLPGEILVIDDCSTDATWRILERLKTNISGLQIRRHARNQGIAVTFSELYDWARRDFVFLNSADGQWKMQILLEMLPLMKDSDLIIARRKQKQYRLSRLLVSWLFNVVPILMFRTKTYDAGSVKLVRREIYNIPLESKGVFAEAERIIRARRRGYRIGSVEVDHFPRVAGKAQGAKPSLVVEAVGDVLRCWFQIVLLRRA